MTTVAVLPDTSSEAGTTYRAVAGDKQSSGKTIGEAIDELNTPMAWRASRGTTSPGT